MAYTIWQCDYEIGKLNTALSQISYIRTYLSNYVTNVEQEASKLAAVYSVNGDATASADRLNKLCNDANETSNYLKNTIVPAINNTIYRLRRIREELEREEERR